jgi:hypothetical protein
MDTTNTEICEVCEVPVDYCECVRCLDCATIYLIDDADKVTDPEGFGCEACAE